MLYAACMNEYGIVKAENSDAEAVCDLHNLAWNEAFSSSFPYPLKNDARNKWETAIRGGTITVHLAASGDSRFGFVAHLKRKDAFEITDLFVTPASRGNGIGRALVFAVLNSTDLPIQLWVADTNIAAIHLYSSLGFSMTARTKQESRRADNANLIEMYRKGGI